MFVIFPGQLHHCKVDVLLKICLDYTGKTLCSDILYNSKILYMVTCICINVPV